MILHGGAAVIALGLSRTTKDADVWLDPLESCEAWANEVLATLGRFPQCTLSQLFPPDELRTDQLAEVIERDGVIRVTGLEKPLDIFREPNELEHLSFNQE